MKTDTIVLGAGMVGICAAVHLQKRGRGVVLVDRRGPAEETSSGNAGLIQREGVVPYMFPREWGKVLDHALGRGTDSHYHLSALPRVAPWMFKYWLASTPEGKARSARALRPLVESCIVEHEALMREAGSLGMIRPTGYLKAYRDEAAFELARREVEADKQTYGIEFNALDGRGLAELEPNLTTTFEGALHMTAPVSVADPEALGKSYAELFTRLGGRLLEGEARSLERVAEGWRIACRQGPVTAREVVVALGPWSDDVMRKLRRPVPLGWKRGYHMHYRAEGNATLNRPLIDTTYGYLITPMTKGIRLTTGAEFALRDAPATPVQLDRLEPHARRVFPLGARVDREPWLGRRPCMPDMVPVIGPASAGQRSDLDGLWLAFGHHHLGFTLGPVTGRLLAEMMLGDQPFTDPTPYRVDRF